MLPAHVEKTVQAIAELHMQHHREATPLQHAVDRMTNVVGRPRSIGFLTFCVAIWVGFNLFLRLSGGAALDPPPFPWLQDAGTLLSLYITILILITQRREDELARRRDQMTLEFAMLGDQKTAKIIALLEELRRDHPEIADRVDPEAAEMSRATRPGAVLDEIKGTRNKTPLSPELKPEPRRLRGGATTAPGTVLSAETLTPTSPDANTNADRAARSAQK